MVYVNLTEDGVIKYPKHQHAFTEIMLYLEGNGYMACDVGKIPFSPGTIIVIPKNVTHGSVSENGFKNISIGGDAQNSFMLTEPVVLRDNHFGEAKRLATLLLETENNNDYYRNTLFEAYLLCLLQMLKRNTPVYAAVDSIINKIKEQAFNGNINLSKILNESGYAEDYIRAKFKSFTGMSPNSYLTKLRMDKAKYLMDIYGDTEPLFKIAENCGYYDYIYFSKKFKERLGVSPRAYLKRD